jgi:hypothetical protein
LSTTLKKGLCTTPVQHDSGQPVVAAGPNILSWRLGYVKVLKRYNFLDEQSVSKMRLRAIIVITLYHAQMGELKMTVPLSKRDRIRNFKNLAFAALNRSTV